MNREQRRRERKYQADKWRWQDCRTCRTRLDAWDLAEEAGRPFIDATGHHFTVIACPGACTVKAASQWDRCPASDMTDDELVTALHDDARIPPAYRLARFDLIWAELEKRDLVGRLSEAPAS